MKASRLIALELVVGGLLAANYLLLIRPNAPRANAAPKPSVAAMADATVVVPLTEVVAPPPPALEPAAPPPAAAPPVPVPRTIRPAPVVKKPAPVTVPAPVVRHLPEPVPSVVKAALAPAPTVTPAPAPTATDLIQRGITSLNAKQWPLALDAFEAARRLQPANPDLGYLRGMALENLGQPGAAIDAYRSCTAGPYTAIAQAHVKTLASKLRAGQ